MRSKHWQLVIAFVVASFLGSTLLFLVQPIIGRFLLPLAGGAPSLWNTSMLFFQAVLLVGYLFAHLANKWLPGKWHIVLQIFFLAAPFLVLPLRVPEGMSIGVETPIFDVLKVLAVMIGLPFLALSTSSPTLQAWFARTDHPSAANPYFLYSAGNVGSMLALISYPFIFEFSFGLKQQSKIWAMMYGLFWLATLVCSVFVIKRPAPIVRKAKTKLTWKIRLTWIHWSFLPSAMMISVTGHITTDIASFPLLWILPLIIYLASFIVSFGASENRLSRHLARSNKIALFALMAVTVTMGGGMWMPVLMSMAAFGAIAFLGHFRLAKSKPEAAHVTEFFAWVSLGGVIGGIFSSLLAPLLFDSLIDFPLLVVLAGSLLIPRPNHKPGIWLVIILLCAGAFAIQSQTPSRALVCLAIVLLYFVRKPLLFVTCLGICMFTAKTTILKEDIVMKSRSFFGAYKVAKSKTSNALVVGTTFHGVQIRDKNGLVNEPGTYYHREGPVSDIFSLIQKSKFSGATFGILGLGIGQMIPYGREQDKMTYFELDPMIVSIASKHAYFSYLKEAKAEIKIETGDGRIELERQNQSFDAIIIDAFSSDAIPIHLLSQEALTLYLMRLSKDGVIAFHISNRFFELEPILGKAAQELNLFAKAWHDQQLTPSDSNKKPSHWVILSSNLERLNSLPLHWRKANIGNILWTDEHFNALGALKF